MMKSSFVLSQKILPLLLIFNCSDYRYWFVIVIGKCLSLHVITSSRPWANFEKTMKKM